MRQAHDLSIEEKRKKIKQVLSSTANSDGLLKKLKEIDPDWSGIMKAETEIDQPIESKMEVKPEPSDPKKEDYRQRAMKRIALQAERKRVIDELSVPKKLRGKNITRCQSIENCEDVDKIRNMECDFYADCLSFAGVRSWSGFSCIKCRYFKEEDS